MRLTVPTGRTTAKHEMIDIHNHILPEIDDGPATMADAVLMARQAVTGGASVVFATPHLLARRDLDKALDMPARVAQLQGALADAGIPLRLMAGMEVYPEDFIIEAVAAGYPITLGGTRKYLLLETPPTQLPMRFEQLIYQLELQGITSILAHPERSAAVQADIRVLEPLVHRGVLLQINGSSLLGQQGPCTEKTARMLLALRWVHFVASDAHSPRGRRPGLAKAARRLADFTGEETVAELIRLNGQRIIDGEPVDSTPHSYADVRNQRRVFDWLHKFCRS